MSKLIREDINNYLATLAALFSYFSTREQFVDTWNIIFTNSCLSDRLLSIIYFCLIIAALLWLYFLLPIFRNVNPNKNRTEGLANQIKNKDRPSVKSKLSFLSLGIRDRLLSKSDITSYDYFSKPNYWESFDPKFDPKYIYRVKRTDDRSYEYIFKKEPSSKTMYVRKTEPGDSKFGEYKEVFIKDCWFLFAFTPFYFLKKRFL